MLQGILHVNLTIAAGPEALEKARRFYVDVMGLPELDRPARIDNGTPGLWLDCGSGQQIHISAEDEAASYNAPSKRHAAFQVSDLALMKEKLEQEGMTVRDLIDQFSGMRRFFSRDPWGNGLEFVQFVDGAE